MRCKSLTSVTIPSTITTIGDEAFEDCDQLTSVSIPNSVSTIGEYAFSGCYRLMNITIGNSVTSIGQLAFNTGCTLDGVIMTVGMVSPVNVVYGSFDALPNNKKRGTLYVPAGSKAAYQSADGWKEFKEIVERADAITMSLNEIRTYCSSNDLDFSGVSGLKAYIVSGFDPVNAKLVLTQVTDVPAGTGLLLKGAEDDYVVPHSTSNMVYSNLLKGVTTTTEISPTDGDYTNFILANGKHGINFYTLSETGDIAAGKAYLQLPSTSIPAYSRGFTLVFDEEATGISDVSSQNNKKDKIYDLQGRIVNNPGKGLYIVNGKKLLIK